MRVLPWPRFSGPAPAPRLPTALVCSGQLWPLHSHPGPDSVHRHAQAVSTSTPAGSAIWQKIGCLRKESGAFHCSPGTPVGGRALRLLSAAALAVGRHAAASQHCLQGRENDVHTGRVCRGLGACLALLGEGSSGLLSAAALAVTRQAAASRQRRPRVPSCAAKQRSWGRHKRSLPERASHTCISAHVILCNAEQARHRLQYISHI